MMMVGSRNGRDHNRKNEVQRINVERAVRDLKDVSGDLMRIVDHLQSELDKGDPDDPGRA